MDPQKNRTSQRAEIIADIEGLQQLQKAGNANSAHTRRSDSGDTTVYVAVTDSEYVVKGMTEWLPNGKTSAWCTAQDQRPSNLDLFQRLEAVVEEPEASRPRPRIEVGFLHVTRQ